MKYQIKGNYFNGRYNPSSQKGPQGVEHFIKRDSPADTSCQLWEMALDYNQMDELIHSSVEGFKFWRKLSIDERINFLKKYQEQVISKRELIAEAISLEMGKPLWEATGEVNSVIGKVDITINDSLPRVSDQNYDEIMPNTKGSVYFRPLGLSLIHI